MSGPKRSEIERENDYRRITDLYLQGKTQAEISSIVGVTQQQISYDLATVQRRWKIDTAINLDEAKQKELSRIDTLERTYWDAWMRSAGEHTKTRTEQLVTTNDGSDDESKESTEESKPEKKPIVLKVVTDTEMLLGVPALLAGVMSCIERRCKLLGLDAPTKIAPTSPDGKEQYDGGITETERAARISAILDRGRTRRDRLSTSDGPDTVETVAGAAE